MTLVIKDGPAFVGDGRILDKATVVMEGDRIHRIGPPDMTIPSDAEVIEIKGGMLLPGFVDCHLHILIDGSPNPLAAVETI